MIPGRQTKALVEIKVLTRPAKSRHLPRPSFDASLEELPRIHETQSVLADWVVACRAIRLLLATGKRFNSDLVKRWRATDVRFIFVDVET